jgi:phenylacetate-CoA ligase
VAPAEMIYEPYIECAPPEQLKAIQAARLRAYLASVAPRIPEYRQRVVKAQLAEPHEEISDEELLRRFSTIDFTDAATYVSIDACALLEIDKRLYYLETTSGTTSVPKSRYATYTDDLVDQRLVARSLAVFEVTPQDRVLTVDLGELNFYALMTKGMAELGIYDSLFYSARTPFDDSMREALSCKPDVLLTVPSILVRSLTGFIESLKSTPSVKKLIYYAEPLDFKLQQYFLKEFGIESFSLYSSIEMGMIGAECVAHDGVHVWTDALFPTLKDAIAVERNNSQNGTQQVLQGSLGLTSLMHTGKPTLAYLLGDTVQYTERPCPCGRTLPRLYFVGRHSETFSIFGFKFTYRQIYEHVYKDNDVTSFLQIVLEDDARGTVMRLVLPLESIYHVQGRQDELASELSAQPGLAVLADHGALHFDFQFVPAEFFTRRKIRLVEDVRDQTGKIAAT